MIMMGWKVACRSCYSVLKSNNENLMCAPVFRPAFKKNNCGVSLFCPQHVERPECQLHRQLGVHTFTSCVTQRTQVSCHFGLLTDSVIATAARPRIALSSFCV